MGSTVHNLYVLVYRVLLTTTLTLSCCFNIDDVGWYYRTGLKHPTCECVNAKALNCSYMQYNYDNIIVLIPKIFQEMIY